jgi:50S ribosomal protein L16 3-hydroxylase
MLGRMHWSGATIGRFAGCYLTEPKPAVFFEPPARALGRVAFARTAAARGIRLDSRTQLLYDDRNVYINGEAIAWPARGATMIARLANARRLSAADNAAAVVSLLYPWYCDGYLHLG